MRSNFFKNIFCIATVLTWLILPQSVQAQGVADDILVANGGQFGPNNFVTVGAWRNINGGPNYVLFDSIAASSVQDLVSQGTIAFMAADSFLVKYSLEPFYSRTNTIPLSGVRKIGVPTGPNPGVVVVTRGFGATGDYVKGYEIGAMTQMWSVSGISGECEGVAIVGDTAYVGVPGSFSDSTGSIAVIDITNGTLDREIELGIAGKNIGRVYAYGGSIWTINGLAFGSTTGVITQYEIATGSITNHAVAGNLSGGAGFHNNLLYLFINGAMGTFDPATGMVSNSSLVPGNWVGSAVDTTDFDIFLTETDFSTFGKLFRFNATGNVVDSVDVGISPEAISRVRYALLPLTDPKGGTANITAWPNPAQNVLHIDASQAKQGLDHLILRDIMGRKILEMKPNSPIFSLDVSQIAGGTYLLEVSTKGHTAVEKIIIRAGK